jgi:hypothetical protein
MSPFRPPERLYIWTLYVETEVAVVRDSYEEVHRTVAQTVRARRNELGELVAVGRLLSDLPPYAQQVATTLLARADACEHLEAASRDSVPDAAYAFADEGDILLCGGCMRLRAKARLNSDSDGSSCDLCGVMGRSYVVVAGVVVITGSLCESCEILWHVPAQGGHAG